MGCVSSLDDIKFKYPLYSDILRTRRRRCFCRCISSIRDGRFQDYLDEMIAAFCLFNSDTCLPQPWMNDIHSRCLLDVLVICISNKSIYIYIYMSIYFCLTTTNCILSHFMAGTNSPIIWSQSPNKNPLFSWLWMLLLGKLRCFLHPKLGDSDRIYMCRKEFLHLFKWIAQSICPNQMIIIC